MTTTLRRFRFGVQISRTRTSQEWKDQARRAEAFGYDIFLMPDHFGQQFAIGPALALVAEATDSLRIGTLVWQNDLRHPALAAMEAATLDVLSEGRFEVGIGAGGSLPPEYEWTGIAFDSASVRVQRLEESIRILKGLAGDDQFSFSGTYFSLKDYQANPKPIQKPYPPLLIAGGGKRMLSLAAREADIVAILPRMLPGNAGFAEDETSLEAFASKVEFIKGVAGDRFAELEFNLLIQMVKVTDDRNGAIDRLKQEHEISDDDWFDSPMVFVGSVDEVVDRIREVRERTGVSYFVVFEPVMEAFSPIVAALAGQ